jgi:hypothetical protein
MLNIINNFSEGILKIEKTWDPNEQPVLDSIGSELTDSYINLIRVEEISQITIHIKGITLTRTLEIDWRISRNGNSWSNFQEAQLIDNENYVVGGEVITKLTYRLTGFPPLDPLDPFFIDVKFRRSGNKSDGQLVLIKYDILGSLLRDEFGDGTFIVNPGGEVVIKPPYIYKIFRIDDFEILSSGDISNLDIMWRFSQDNSRTWSQWEPFNGPNISTKRINPIRFFQVEYLVKNSGQLPIKVNDINLIGDFQNVTLDSLKTNLFGIRECCQSNLVSVDNGSGMLSGETCSTEDGRQLPMTPEQKAMLYNPYQQASANNFLNKLSNDAMEVFGHRVQYFVTDPDGRGIDYTLHEFGLFNISCEGEIKVAVEGNQFPDNQITMNQFDLNLFDSFEIHITKESFKSLFGVQRRPSKEDLVYFCDLNRLFIVDHAQQFRGFNNYSIYYKVVLKKYNKSANVIPGSQSIEDRISQLTNNSTVDSLFGIENNLDKKSVANKKEQQALSRNPIRLDIIGINLNSIITRGLIENSDTIISKQHYDLSKVTAPFGTPAIRYKDVSPIIRESDNIGFTIWFRFNNYMSGEVYNFYEHRDETNELGWSLNLENDVMGLKINNSLIEMPISEELYEDVWYGYVLNIDQRMGKVTQWIYKRDVNIGDESSAKFLPNTILKLVDKFEVNATPQQWELEDSFSQIRSSDMRITNIRLFNDIIPEDSQNRILNQYIIGDDSKYIVFGDNANTRIILPNFNDRSQPED